MLRHTAARLLSGGESWRIAADEHNFILLSSREEQGRYTLHARATARDDTSDTKAKALQARGWTISRYSTVKGLLAGGVDPWRKPLTVSGSGDERADTPAPYLQRLKALLDDQARVERPGDGPSSPSHSGAHS